MNTYKRRDIKGGNEVTNCDKIIDHIRNCKECREFITDTIAKLTATKVTVKKKGRPPNVPYEEKE